MKDSCWFKVSVKYSNSTKTERVFYVTSKVEHFKHYLRIVWLHLDRLHATVRSRFTKNTIKCHQHSITVDFFIDFHILADHNILYWSIWLLYFIFCFATLNENSCPKKIDSCRRMYFNKVTKHILPPHFLFYTIDFLEFHQLQNQKYAL